MSHDQIVGLYDRHSADFDRDRDRSLREKPWLDRFLAHVADSGTVLDIGCGMGEPIARYIIASGRRLTGVDSSPSMIGLARGRFPNDEWIVGDMRRLDLGRCFDGILAWDSFFHLRAAEQRVMFTRFADHAKAGAPLMFTSGTSCGESVGSYHGEPLYHASLDSSEYRELLEQAGFEVREHMADDPECGGRTIWLATARAVKHRGT